MAGRKAEYDVIAHDKASSVMNKVAASAEKTGSSLGKLGGLAKKGVLGITGLAGGAGYAAKQMFDASVSVEAMGNKAKVVFGQYFPQAEQKARLLGRSLGMSTQEVLGLTAGFGDLLTPMGFTQKQAADMSGEMGTLTAALAQWSGGTKTAADVGDILADALTGEYDSLKSLGVQLDADTIKAKLHAAGKDKLTGAALKQATAEIALKEITAQSSNALKGYTDKTNKLALAKNTLSSRIKNLRDGLATKLVPTFAKVADVAGVALDALTGNSELGEFDGRMRTLNDTMVVAGERLRAFGSWVGPKLLVALRASWRGIQFLYETGQRLGNWFSNSFMPAIRPVIHDALPMFKKGLDTIKSAFASSGKQGTDWKGILHTVGQVVTTVAKVAIPALAAAFVVVATNVKTLVWAFRNVLWPALKLMTQASLNMFGAIINGAAHALGWVPGIGPKLKTAAAAFNKFRDQVNASLNGIHDQTIVMRIVGKGNIGGSRSQKNAKDVRDIASQRAVGGYVRPGGVALVNENGPEFAYFPGGGTVMTSGQTARMMRGGGNGGGPTTIVNVTVQGAIDPVATARQIKRILAQAGMSGTLA